MTPKDLYNEVFNLMEIEKVVSAVNNCTYRLFHIKINGTDYCVAEEELDHHIMQCIDNDLYHLVQGIDERFAYVVQLVRSCVLYISVAVYDGFYPSLHFRESHYRRAHPLEVRVNSILDILEERSDPAEGVKHCLELPQRNDVYCR